MPDLHAVDVKVKQQYYGALCSTGFTWGTDSNVPLTTGNLVDFADELIANFIPKLLDVQNPGVVNISMHLQARGVGGTPSYFLPITGEGTYPGFSSIHMPPELAYWYRYGVAQTYRAIGGTVETVHPIKKGGSFIAGVVDTQLNDGVFKLTPDMELKFTNLANYQMASTLVDGITYTGSVLAEAIDPAEGWWIAEIEAAFPIRVTRLRSRLVQY